MYGIVLPSMQESPAPVTASDVETVTVSTADTPGGTSNKGLVSSVV